MYRSPYRQDKKPNCKKGKVCGDVCIPKKAECKEGSKRKKAAIAAGIGVAGIAGAGALGYAGYAALGGGSRKPKGAGRSSVPQTPTNSMPKRVGSPARRKNKIAQQVARMGKQQQIAQQAPTVIQPHSSQVPQMQNAPTVIIGQNAAHSIQQAPTYIQNPPVVVGGAMSGIKIPFSGANPPPKKPKTKPPVVVAGPMSGIRVPFVGVNNSPRATRIKQNIRKNSLVSAYEQGLYSASYY